MDKVFGRRLKELREEKDMKQSDIDKVIVDLLLVLRINGEIKIY